MATPSSLFNFLSFLLPSKPPPPRIPPTQLQLQTQKQSRDSFHPLVAKKGHYTDYSESLSPELASVIHPSLAFSNTLFFKSAYNVQVIVADNEPEERLLNRFRREVMRAGVIQECKRRRYFENKHDKQKRKSREAAKRNRRRRPFSRVPSLNKEEASTSKKWDDGEDNWDLPEGDIPY